MGRPKGYKVSAERPLTEKEELFSKAIVLDKMGRKSAYKLAYKTSPDDHDRQLRNKADEVFNRPAVQRYMNELREAIKEEAAKEAIWTRDDSLTMLADIARISKEAMLEKVKVEGKEMDVYDSKAASAAVKALAEINKMLGLNQPEQQNVTIRLGDDLDDYAR